MTTRRNVLAGLVSLVALPALSAAAEPALTAVMGFSPDPRNVDDYEEGEFTCEVIGASAVCGHGVYTKCGPVVMFACVVENVPPGYFVHSVEWPEMILVGLPNRT